MPIPASKIVEVNPSVLIGGGNDLEFNALFLTTSSKISQTAVVVGMYSHYDAVGEVFGEDSDEYKLAQKYFVGYDGSYTKPSKLYIASMASSASKTPAEIMAEVLKQTQNFVTFMTVDDPSEAQAEGFADWADEQGVAYLYVFNETEDDEEEFPVATAIKAGNHSACVGIYGSPEYAAFLCGLCGSIDYNRSGGAITAKFKNQSGIAANVDSATKADALAELGLNFVGDYASRNDQFVFLANGSMYGKYEWIDTYLNAIWLNNALQTACMVGFQNTPRVPYTPEGYALIRAWCQDPVDRALRNGVIEGGVTLSNAQKAEIQLAVGEDISEELYTDGYKIIVEDADSAVRQQRKSPPVWLYYTYGGSVHNLKIASIAVV